MFQLIFTNWTFLLLVVGNL